jgi:type II secretory pathway component PulF
MNAPAGSMPSYASPAGSTADWSAIVDSGAAGNVAGPASAVRPAPPPQRRVRISKRDQADLTSRLAMMLRSGKDVAGALELLSRQTRRPALGEVLQNIHQEVLDGKSFSQALRQYESVFGGTYVAMIGAGEASGRMADVLAQLADMQRTELKRRSTIRTMLAYPVLLTSVSGLVIMGLVLFVLPTFASIFKQYETPLPCVTRILVAVSLELRVHWWLWGPLAVGTLTGAVLFLRSETGRNCWDRTLLKAPILRDVTQALLAGRTCRLLGMMLQSGVPLLETLALARAAVRNSLYHELFVRLEYDVTNGRGLGEALLSADFMPPSAAEMVETAEETGNLGGVTQLLGEHFEEEGENRLRELVAILEPAVTVAMGVVVAMIVLAVMLPMLDLTTFAEQGN